VNDLSDNALVAVIHLPALPGSAGNTLSLDEIVQQVHGEAGILQDLGFDALLVENFGDVPFRATVVEPHTVAMMSQCLAALGSTKIPIGVNVLRNDPLAALAIAAATWAQFIRVNVHTGVYATDQGTIEGRAEETLQYRQRLGLEVAIFADVHIKHAQPLSQPDIALAAEETAFRGGADAIVVSGSTTGRPAELADLKRVREAVSDRPVYVGSGVTPDNVQQYLELSDGVLVGSCLQAGGVAGNLLDPKLAETFINAARS